MKFFVIFAATVALASATAEVQQNGSGDALGRIIRNEILRTNRRIFSRGAGGGWGSSGGGGGGSGDGGYRAGPPPPPGSGVNGGLLNLFNAMSNFGLNSNYGPPSGGSPSPFRNAGISPSSQYGPPGSGSGGSRPPSSQYGAPAPGAGNGGLSGGLLGGAVPTRSRIPTTSVNPGLRNNAGGVLTPEGGKIFRYVSLFTAPEDPAPPRPKIVRAGPSTPDKHVNIIFVRPPTPASDAPTEVLLAPEPERKTIVYVLMKKPAEGQETVRVRPALPTQPSKPEVFFIPYSDPSGQQQGEGGDGSNNGEGGYGNGPSGGSNNNEGGYNNGPAGGSQGGPSNGGYSNGGNSLVGPSSPGPSNSILFSGAVGVGGYA